MEKHLKSKQHYIDLYDRHTVEQCRRLERLKDTGSKKPARPKGVTKAQDVRMRQWIDDMFLWIEKGERYLNKESTIRKWIDRDRQRDELYEFAEAPENIRCLTCRNRMQANFKELWQGVDEPDRVLFMFDCPNKCLPRRAFFHDGEEWRRPQNLCPHCNTQLKQEMEDNGEKLVTKSICSNCDYMETDEYMWSHKQDEGLDENFATDRERFCLTEKEGKKYFEEKLSMEQLAKFAEEWDEKEKERAKKLEENPKGFHLDGAGYTCAICRNSTPEGDNWYDKWGIKCLVCQRAIDKKEIPPSLAKNKDSWYTKYDIERAFNVKTQTLRKWVRDGIIKARNISHYGEGVHTQLFLIKDNKDFLPPKNLVKSESTNVKEDGKVVHKSVPWYQIHNPHEHLKEYKIMDYLRIVPAEEIEERAKAKEKKRKMRQRKKRR